jgi:hypothetical protein
MMRPLFPARSMGSAVAPAMIQIKRRRGEELNAGLKAYSSIPPLARNWSSQPMWQLPPPIAGSRDNPNN